MVPNLFIIKLFICRLGGSVCPNYAFLTNKNSKPLSSSHILGQEGENDSSYRFATRDLPCLGCVYHISFK